MIRRSVVSMSFLSKAMAQRSEYWALSKGLHRNAVSIWRNVIRALSGRDWIYDSTSSNNAFVGVLEQKTQQRQMIPKRAYNLKVRKFKLCLIIIRTKILI